MKHTLFYMGPFAPNFDSLTAETVQYEKRDGSRAPIDAPLKSADGLAFGYMEKPKGCFAVRVGSVVLDVPVLIRPNDHCDGKGFGPGGSLFGDESALHLVADAIRANPHLGEALLAELWQIRAP